MAVTSPLPKDEKLISFMEAFKQVIEGKRITQADWPEGYYTYMDKQLMLVEPEGEKHQWIISKEDTKSSKWKVLNSGKEN